MKKEERKAKNKRNLKKWKKIQINNNLILESYFKNLKKDEL
jgi:hypothetical protein